MALDFAEGITVGGPSDLYQRQRAIGDVASVPASDVPRGLALASLRVTGAWDRLWNLLGRRSQIYFLSIAFDLSDHRPVVLPPKELPEGALYRVRHGEAIEFTLGDGAPVFLPRVVIGGLVVYLTVCEADKGIRHVGEVMAQIHEDLSADKSLTNVIRGFVTNPGKTAADEMLSAATAALQPIATILKTNDDDHEALFTGIYPAKGPWRERLQATQSGTTIELRELR